MRPPRMSPRENSCARMVLKSHSWCLLCTMTQGLRSLAPYARSIVDSGLQGNGLLDFERFLNAVVDGDGEHYEDPHGEDTHSWNSFGDQSRQQRPSPAEYQKQNECRCRVQRPLQRR